MGYARPWHGPGMAKPSEDAEARDPALHRARGAYLGLLVFTAVVYGRPQDYSLFLQYLHVAQLVVMATAFVYIITLLRGKAPLLWSTELKLVLGLTVWFAAGIPFAYWRWWSYYTFTGDWMKTVVIFFLLTQTVVTLDRVRRLMWVILLCELLVSTVTILFPNFVVVTDDGRVQGTGAGFLSGNYLGIAAATTLPYIAALVVLSKSWIRAILLFGTFGLVMWMVVLTASRASLIAIVFSLGLVWVLVLRDSYKARLMGFVFLIAFAIAMVNAPAMFWDRIRTIWDEESYATSSTSLSATHSEYQRKALFRRSIQVTLEYPVFGVGLWNFQNWSGNTTGGAHEWKGTHNTYTQISSEAGIPAFLMFISLLYVAVRNMWRVNKFCRDRPDCAELGLLARATFVSLVCFMFTACFAHLGYDCFFYYLAGLGVALSSMQKRVLERERGAPAKFAPASQFGNGSGLNGRMRSRLA